MDMSKGDFAKHIKVSAARVSQYIQSGIIGPEALIGEGRNARIDVEVATAQISQRRHVGQSLGNGLMTRLEGKPAPASLSSATPGDDGHVVIPRDTASLIQLEKLDQERRKNRQAERDEAVANGRLVEGEELQRQVGKAAQRVVAIFDGMAPDIADAIAAKFALPARDVLHLVKQVMREKRAAKAAELATEAEALPATKEAIVA